MPFVGRGVVYAYMGASIAVLAAIAALGQLSWTALAGVLGPTAVLTAVALIHDVYQLLKVIPERDWALVQKAEQLDRLPRPYVEFAGCRARRNLAVEGAVAERYGKMPAVRPVETFDVCQVAVRNKPPAHAKGSVARNAVALVEYFLPEGRQPVLALDHGKWAGGLVGGPPDAETLRRDLFANGEIHWIDVALKVKGAPDWYALDGAAGADGGWRDPDYAILHPEMRVRVTVLAEGMDEEVRAEYWLDSFGSDTIYISETRRLRSAITPTLEGQQEALPPTERAESSEPQEQPKKRRPQRGRPQAEVLEPERQDRTAPAQEGVSRENPQEERPTGEDPSPPPIPNDFYLHLARVSRKASPKKSSGASSPSSSEQ
jgi:hypothetical protein